RVTVPGLVQELVVAHLHVELEPVHVDELRVVHVLVAARRAELFRLHAAEAEIPDDRAAVLHDRGGGDGRSPGRRGDRWNLGGLGDLLLCLTRARGGSAAGEARERGGDDGAEDEGTSGEELHGGTCSWQRGKAPAG